MLIAVLGFGLAGVKADPQKGRPETLPTATTAVRLPPQYKLEAAQVWQVNTPNNERFDASALLWTKDQQLLTVNDRGPDLFRILFRDGESAVDLKPVPGLFTPAQLAQFARTKKGRYDTEGIAQDEQGRIYICEEGDRWVLRTDPSTHKVERLVIDWSPVAEFFNPKDPNASFEGIAVGGGRLYVANERSRCRLIVVQLDTLKVVDHFIARPVNNNAAEFHYTDLCYFEHSLWVLLRESRTVLQVDPTTHKLLAQFDFGHLELRPDLAYLTSFPTGSMEGLSVTRDSIWLLTDNNGMGRIKFPKDIRPTLFRCPRPDQARSAVQ